MPVASASASASPKSASTTKPFDSERAHAALAALVPKLAPCKLAKGSAWSVKVTYAPDGHVLSAVPVGKHAAAQSACVSAPLKKATIAPFAGRPTPYVFNFVAGSK
ncbi:hypothetical protein AKJ09_01654 [Labilithrix luteola]|uniref:TolA protein n=1 Tax=Labilithrix luteola TaxID=1391654 RepID=A0A0K1PN73_9BACT|nr:hypothetical protein AKJ09_01654 [Labilithrix luteola]